MVSRSAPAVFDRVLRQAAAGSTTPLCLVDDAGRSRTWHPAAWYAAGIPGDAGLLRRTHGTVLDVGCGPGRLTAALGSRDRLALGIDISPTAVRITRRRGGAALLGDVFGPLPLEGRWRRILLADGNIGIAGDPTRLLRRCADLLDPGGQVLAELDPPGAPTWSGRVRLRAPGRCDSPPVRWAYVGVDAIARLADTAALRVCALWMEEDRWFAGLALR